MKTKLSKQFWLALVLFSLIGQVAWVVENMYFNVFIYKQFHASAADISNMVAASAVAATLTTIFIGALSDKLGKRKIFMCGGYILWGISIFLFSLIRLDVIEAIFPMAASAASVGVSLVLIMDCIMTFFGSSANDAAFNAWLTDSTDATNRGAAEGINAMMPLVAILAVFGGFMAFDLDRAESWNWIFTIIGGVVFLVGIVGIFVIQDPAINKTNAGYFSTIAYGFLPATVKQNKKLYLALAMFVLFNISIQIFMPYLIIYYEVSLGMADYVLIMAPAIILASVVTALWGRVYDKKGYLFTAVICLLWLVAGYVILYLFRATVPVFIGSLLMMSGYLAGMAVFGALIRDNTPAGKAGQLQGIRIVAQVLLPGVIGPYIGKAVLSGADTVLGNDGTYSFIPTADIFAAACIPLLLLIPFLLLPAWRKKPSFRRLTTPYTPGSIPFDVYPRPQQQRDRYHNLNGLWQLSVETNGTKEALGDILVPFPPESALSGIGRVTKKGDVLVYEKDFTFMPYDEKTLLHFGAVDTHAEVYCNGHKVAEHHGGYLPFTADVTQYIHAGENHLRVLVTDPLDHCMPYGKQTHKRDGMWYTPVSGIWQTVWLECVPEQYIRSLRITPSCKSVTIEVIGGQTQKVLTLDGKQYPFTGDSITICPEKPILWTPETPHLYHFTLDCGKDRIRSYFALRELSIRAVQGNAYICLNGNPYYFHGLLDQGYFSDGIYLPGTPQGYLDDILKMKSLGFNMLRKHIKIEPDIFYYYCDLHGMTVFQDMVNSGRYSFLVDTALPTIGLQKGLQHHYSEEHKQIFRQSALDTIQLLYNHPSIVYYTIFNEGWGQHDATAMYQLLKKADPTRIWDTASGWFKDCQSDVISDHVYFKPIRTTGDPVKPAVLSEFGGYACAVEGHIFNPDREYGYRKCPTLTAFMDDLEVLYLEQVQSAIRRGVCATVMTQLSDVEDETNGMVTYDRQVVKVDPERMKEIASILNAAFAETVQSS